MRPTRWLDTSLNAPLEAYPRDLPKGLAMHFFCFFGKKKKNKGNKDGG